MIKKIFKISLVFSMLFLIQPAKADEMTIGTQVYPSITSLGVKSENYYTVVFVDPASTETTITSVIMYIPKEIFANGTYDLAYLKSESDSVDDAVEACENPDSDDDTEVTLPSTDKVYILGGVTKIRESGEYIIGKGTAIANKSFGGTKVTISGIGSGENAPTIEQVNFNVDGRLPFTTVQYKVFVTEDCQEIVNKSKFSISKKAKRTSFALDATATIIDSNFGF